MRADLNKLHIRWLVAALLAVTITGCEEDESDSGYEPPEPTATQQLESELRPVTSGVGDPRTAVYPTANPSPTIVVNTGTHHTQFQSEDLPAPWLSQSVEETELVIDSNVTWDELNSQKYGDTGNATLIRRRNVARIRVLSARTGAEIDSETFKGAEPGGFPATWTFSSPSSELYPTDYLDGEPVPDQTILEFIRPHVEHP